MAYFLPAQVDFFPHPLESDEDGLLAMGSAIEPEVLLLAYQFGIFPWSNEGEPTFWYYTHPRCILYPDQVRITKSMRPYLNGDRFTWTLDKDFEAVIAGCKRKKRVGQAGTWIYDRLEAAFIELHKMGYVHSLEVWDQEGRLVGGLYGMALGKVFYGESMFADVSNASKFGLIKMCQWLQAHDFWLVDCQQRTQHILSMGAETIEKDAFMAILRKNVFQPNLVGKWEK